ncbi:MAG: site-specific DNA-methyltransferase [Ruthenibacterium lactatiformans]|jgi:adenine-specific DNA-methyltransferase
MAAINDLIRQITDPDLRDRIQKEVDKLAKQKKFGLVFEEHLPECTPLYDIPVRRGVKAALKAGDVSDFYQVLKVEEGKAICIKRGETEAVEFPVDDLVTIAEFGEPIYPYLKPIDTVCNAPDSELWHTLIEADNYHALQLLEYLYAGKVDCIYIDPPYNTGARDWKYNNDYVDTNDVYRHSKWLSFIEKRLFIARRLLNKRDSVLIVTIDEKEYLHLGCLLEEMFPEAQIQMISISINPSGAIRKNMFSRADEYAFVLFFGDAHVNQMKGEGEETEVRWWYLRRLEYGSRRGTVKGGIAQFYPIYIDNETMKIVKIGDPLPHTQDRNTVPTIEGTTTVFPIRDDGLEMNWGVTRETLKRLIDNHVVQISPNKNSQYQPYTIKYLSENYQEKIASGRWAVRGYREDGSKIVVETGGKVTRATTVWKETRYDAKTYGTVLLKNIIGDARFSFPKSLYSVADTLRYFVMDKPDALIIDFFAGSGTTLHAVNLLNAEDGGHRRCVIVTNNEVSDTEAKEMTKRGLKPGDEEWEALGIARYVTWPRTVCAIEGHDVNGNPLKGNYLGSDIPMSDGFNSNAIYFKLGFLDKTAVALGMQFKEMLPVLWMKAGAIGKCPEVIGTVPDMLILPGNRFAVLINENAFAAFEEAVNNTPEIQTVFIVTDYEVNYRAMIKNLTVEASYQLYRDYLDNFRINHGRN